LLGGGLFFRRERRKKKKPQHKDKKAHSFFLSLSLSLNNNDNQQVTTFLAWAAEPEHDDRKLMGAKWILVMTLVWATALYYKRWKWAPIKSRRIVVDALH